MKSKMTEDEIVEMVESMKEQLDQVLAYVRPKPPEAEIEYDELPEDVRSLIGAGN